MNISDFLTTFLTRSRQVLNSSLQKFDRSVDEEGYARLHAQTLIFCNTYALRCIRAGNMSRAMALLQKADNLGAPGCGIDFPGARYPRCFPPSSLPQAQITNLNQDISSWQFYMSNHKLEPRYLVLAGIDPALRGFAPSQAGQPPYSTSDKCYMRDSFLRLCRASCTSRMDV